MNRVLVLIAAVLLLPIVAQAAEDLLDAYQAGREYDPRFQAARYEYEAAREKIPQAKAELLPSLAFDARRSETEQDISSRSNPVFGVGTEDFTTKAWNFEARQSVFRMSSWIQLSQSKAVVRQAYAQFTAAEQELMLRTAALYLNLLAAKDGLDLAEAELAAVGRQLELVQAQRRGGLASITDEYEAKARYSLVEADVIQARYQLDDAYQGLREVVGDSVTSVMRLQDDIPLVGPTPASITDWVAEALEQNLALMAKEEAVAVAEYEVKRLRAGHYPTVDLAATHGSVNAGGSVTGGASNVDTSEITLNVRVPIYNGGFVSSQTREASMNYQRALQERKQEHRTVMRETRGAYQGIISAISRVEALSDSLTSQQSVLEGKSRGYRSGVNTLLDVLDAESDLYETGRDLAQARYQYLINLLQLKRQSGTLSEGDLEYLNGMLDDGSLILLSHISTGMDATVTGRAFGPVGNSAAPE